MKADLSEIIRRLFSMDSDPIVTRPESKFGDYTTNVALQIAGQLGQQPRIVAEKIATELEATGLYKEVSIAGPGFINVVEKNDSLLSATTKTPEQFFDGKRIVFEYSCPNAFKELHTGHLYQTIFGDILARLMVLGGAKLHRTSFGGDVGLHVAKCLWGVIAELGGEDPAKLAELNADPVIRTLE